MKVRKLPVEVEAIQYKMTDKGFCDFEYTDWINEAFEQKNLVFSDRLESEILFVNTVGGVMIVHENDWLIKGINGELYICNDEVFKKSYEIVEEGN